MPENSEFATVRRPAASVGAGDHVLVYNEHGTVRAKVKDVQHEDDRLVFVLTRGHPMLLPLTAYVDVVVDKSPTIA